MFMKLIENRRSIRKYLDRPIPDDTIEKLVEAALRAPSSRSINPWEFIVVTDRKSLVKLSAAKEHGSSFLRNAPLGIVVCGDKGKSDVWVEDVSIASIFIQLTAQSFGLGSCWIQIRKRMHDKEKTADRFVAETLGLPEHLTVESMIAIGYPAEELPPHGRETLAFDKISYNRHGATK